VSAGARHELAACLGLFCTGVYSTSFGPALPVLARDFGVSLDAAGLLITVLFLGSILASGAVAVRLHVFDPRGIAALGLVAIASGAVALALADAWWAALASVTLVGAGDGLMVAGVHTIVARVSADVTRGINRLNVCFAVGAVFGPLWSGGVLEIDETARPVVYLAIAVLALGVGVFTWLGGPVAAAKQEPGGHGGGMNALAWAMGVVLFLYVGAEFGLGSWVASYAEEAFDAGTFTGGVVTSCYWGALMVGRLVSGSLFARGVPAGRVLLGSIIGGLVASAGIAAASEGIFALALLAAAATGLAFGPIWPAAISIASQGRSGNAPAAMVTIGNSGGFVFPWIQGQVLVASGATVGIGVSAVLCLGMLLVAWVSLGRAQPEPGR